MNQPKIQRVLRLIVLLSGNRIYTVDELAEELETSQRTIYRYIDTFKEAGFAIEKVDDYKYRLISLGTGIKDLKKVVYFSPEEALIIDQLIDSLDPSNSLRNELKSKLAAIARKASITEFSNRPAAGAKVKRLVDAISERKVVHIKAYSSSYSGQTKDYTVEPFEMTSNYAGVWGYDLEAGKNKRFLISRMGDVVKTSEFWSKTEEHHSIPMDAFRIHGEEEYHVVLRMNNVAKNLMVELYPLTEQFISPQMGLEEPDTELCSLRQLILTTHDMDNEEEEYWLFDGMVRGLDGVGRFVLSMEDNIEVLEGDLLIEYLLEHARRIIDTYEE